MAVAQIANQISQGQIDVGIGCGVEHMSTGQDNPTLAPKMSEDVLKGEEVKDVLLPMGITSENVSFAFQSDLCTLLMHVLHTRSPECSRSREKNKTNLQQTLTPRR
jgi:hypothetical protein